ncbi:MAG: RDD family protein [Micromonosporaceae bacterium]
MAGTDETSGVDAEAGDSEHVAAAGDDLETAGFGARFLALLVDWVLCVMLAGLVARPPATGLWVYPFLIAEYGFFVGLYGQTPGMWLAKVRCVSATDTGPIGVLRALLRTLLMCLLVPVLIMDSYGRGLHDRAVNSVMLAAPRR